MKTYLFYDLETTGLNPAFDQVLHFAAIRCDMGFKEIERHEIKVKLRPDIILSPYAIITHRIPINDMMNGICEFEAARQIHSLLNEPETISVGYNNLGFDDEFLRFSFYRNLLPPYTHQYGKGCRRMDILPMTVIYRLYNDQILRWPVKNGKTSLKLENLTIENNLAQGRSHDAMTDVEATIALARKLKSEKKMWEYLSGYFIKKIDQERVENLPVSFETTAGSHRTALMTGIEFGPEQQYQVPVLSIGESTPYGNQSLWLRIDLPELRDTELTTISRSTWVARKKFGEPGVILPPHERYWQRLSEERRENSEKNLEWLKSNMNLFLKITEHHRDFRYPLIPDIDADAALYQSGFPTDKTQNLCRKFHSASITGRKDMVFAFTSPEIRTLAGRILARNFAESAPIAILTEFKKYMKKIDPEKAEDAILDYKGKPRLTPHEALSQISDIRASGDIDAEQLNLLSDLEKYIKQFCNRKPE